MTPHEVAALVQALATVMATEPAKEFFNHPVDAVALGLDDYHDVVTRPMSLREVLARVQAGGGHDGHPGASNDNDATTKDAEAPTPYPSLADALQDIRQVWRNCRVYNSSFHMAHLRRAVDALDETLRESLAKAGITSLPLPSDLPEQAKAINAHITEIDIPEKYNAYLGEQLPYRVLDGWTVCVATDAFETAPCEAADFYDKWVLENGEVDGEGEGEGDDANRHTANRHDGNGFTEKNRAGNRTRVGVDQAKIENQPPPRLAAYGWLAVPTPLFEPADDLPGATGNGTQQSLPQLAKKNKDDEDDDDDDDVALAAATKAKAEKTQQTRVKVWLPRVLDWSIDYENPQSMWLITESGWYRMLDPSGEYSVLFKEGVSKKFDLAARAVNVLKQDPLASWDDALPKILAAPPKPGRPRGRPPKDRSLVEEDKKDKKAKKGGRGGRGGGRGKKGKKESEGDGDADAYTKETKETRPEKVVEKPKPAARDLPPDTRWGDSGTVYSESTLVELREFVLSQLEACVAAGVILTSTGKLSRHMKAFCVVLEEKGEAADFDARRKAEREVRWAVAEEDAFEEEKSNLHHTKQSAEDFTVFAAPSPPTVSRHSADARPVRGLAKADASALATAAALRAKRLRHKKHVPTPPSAKWDFGVEPGMVGDTLAVWDLCSRYADFWRLPPFPFARLAAALCPDRRGDNFGSTDFGATTPGGHLPVSTPGKVRGDSLLPNGKTPVATTVWAMSPMGPPDTSKTSIGVPTAFSTAVGAEWLDAQPGDAELASECLLRDVHCAFLRVIDNTDVELQQAPVRSSAEGGGGALPVGWPERVRVLIEARPAAHVKDAAFGAARALRKKELTACPPKAKLALLQCLASLAVDSPAFGAHAKHVKDVRDACGNPDLIGIDSTGSKYWRLGANAGIGAVFVEKPGFEKNELNEPAVGGGTARENFDSLAAQNMANDDDVAHTPDTSLKTAAPGAESRVSSRVRHKPVKFEDTSMVDAKAASCAKAEKEKESSTRTPKKATETQTKWCWYPASAFTALAEWLRDSGDAGDETLAEALLTPPEVPEDLVFGGAKNDDDDDDDAMDADDDAGELDVVELTAAVASALAQRKRGGGTALDGYVGLDRPLTRGVSPDGPRALVALRVNLTQTLSGYPFWEDEPSVGELRDGVVTKPSRASRFVPLAELARTLSSFAEAARAVLATEQLFHTSNVLTPSWRSKRQAWLSSVDSARTTPALAICLHSLHGHVARKHTGRVKMLREAFQRVGRVLSTVAPPSERMPNAPFLPQIHEHVVLSRLGLKSALGLLFKKLAVIDTPEARLNLGVPTVPPNLPGLTKCRVEFAGYRKGDANAATPAQRIPHAWYLLTPIEAMAPSAAFGGGAETKEGRDAETKDETDGDGTVETLAVSKFPPPPVPQTPLVVAQHVFSGMGNDFLLPFAETDAVLRRPWRPGDRVRKSFVDLRQKIKNAAEDKEEKKEEKGAKNRHKKEKGADKKEPNAENAADPGSLLGKRGRTKPVGIFVSGVVVKTEWWRGGANGTSNGTSEETKGRRSATQEKTNELAKDSKNPWTCAPDGAVCVLWDEPPPLSAEAQAGVPAVKSDGLQCAGACWISPWDVECDQDEERRRAKEFAAEQRRLDKEMWLARYHSDRERRDLDRAEKGLAPLDDDDDSPNAPKRFCVANTQGAPRAVAIPQEQGFVQRVHDFHAQHPDGPGVRLKVPTFCHVELDLFRVFCEVQSRGGFRAVSGAKRWREVCRSLGHDLSGQTSASFAMRQNYERCLLDFEAHLCEEEDKVLEKSSKRKRVEGDETAAKRPRRA